MSDEFTLYNLVGGDATFQRLVDIFYTRVEADALLRPMFPDDLGPGKERQFLFLTQFFGGPARYNERRGRARLRLRHSPFAIDAEARDHWLGHMLHALDEVGIEEPMRGIMRTYLERASAMLINTESPEAVERDQQG